METQSALVISQDVRLFQWVGLSLFVHVALVTFVGGAPQRYQHRPLVVDIQHIPPTVAEPLTRPLSQDQTIPDIAVENLLPQVPNPVTAIERPPTTPNQAVDLPVPFDHYLSVAEVEVRAEPANDVPLSYPASAYMRRIAGVVRLKLFISEKGKLDRVELLDAAPKGIFENEALATVSKLYFYPATRYGRPVKSQKTIEVVFDPNPALDRYQVKPGTPTPVP